MPHRQQITLYLLLIAFIVLAVLSPFVHLLTQGWWFESVGFGEVFWTRILWQGSIGVGTFIAYGTFLWGNYRLANHLAGDTSGIRFAPRAFSILERQGFGLDRELFPKYIAVVGIPLAAVGAATISISFWETVLKFLNSREFGKTDPIFGRDIGFYLFQLPFYEGLRNWLLVLLAGGLAISLAIYGFKGFFVPGYPWQAALPRAIATHLSLLLAAIALVFAVSFWLGRYNLLYSSDGAIFGAGYTDVHARLQAYWLMSFITLALAILLIASIWARGITLSLSSIGIYFLIFVAVDGVYPWVQQQFIVEPNELAKEKPYITHNIEMTRQAYGLDIVQTQDYPVRGQLTRQDLQQNQSTLSNIRLWDYRPLLSTYRQLQEIRLYYHFADIDIDRYTLKGDYRQVMLSPRELSYSQVPARAKTWVNQRLKYTHGYGLVMSPVNTVTPGGLPELFIRDIPPVSKVDLSIAQPAIYYGEETDSYIFTGTTTPEFDYPQGDENAFTYYRGKGGVPMGSLGRRLAYAYDFGNLKILISNYMSRSTRVHYHRQIADRVGQIAPFLRFDRDPYLCAIDGQLLWIIDAYTVSNRYPYSEPVARSNNASPDIEGEIQPMVRGDINYIRNSVKVVIDAYNGTLRFFAIAEDDPILNTYRHIFPHLFESSTAIPPQIKEHFRYPPDLFKIQGQMYLSYHMGNPEVFYNREDLWRFPTEVYEGNPEVMDPYYVIMRLPGETKEEFMLISPFTPVNKDNMVAWMAARCDREHYGKLLLYEFPKQELVYGPSQIEARIDQNPEISQQLTLWSQEGSRVIRGDLLVIPIEQSLLYIEPIYLRAEQGELPELKRVIVAYENQMVMAASFEESLNAIFGRQSLQPSEGNAAGEDISTLTQSAIDLYQKAQEALRQGDWNRYGQYQQELGQRLEQLLERSQ